MKEQPETLNFYKVGKKLTYLFITLSVLSFPAGLYLQKEVIFDSLYPEYSVTDIAFKLVLAIFTLSVVRHFTKDTEKRIILYLGLFCLIEGMLGLFFMRELLLFVYLSFIISNFLEILLFISCLSHLKYLSLQQDST